MPRLEWNDDETYLVRVGGTKLRVVSWIISKDHKQVQALAEDGRHYPLYKIIIPSPAKPADLAWTQRVS